MLVLNFLLILFFLFPKLFLSLFTHRIKLWFFSFNNFLFLFSITHLCNISLKCLAEKSQLQHNIMHQFKVERGSSSRSTSAAAGSRKGSNNKSSTTAINVMVKLLVQQMFHNLQQQNNKYVCLHNNNLLASRAKQ